MAEESQIGFKSRREFMKLSTAAVTAAAAIESDACAPLFRHVEPFKGQPEPHDVVIIGSGFGAMVAATQLAGKVNSILMLERGVFFTSPERPVPPFFGNLPNDKKLWTTDDFQYWATPDNDGGLRGEFLKLVRLHRGGDYFADKHRVPLYNYSQFQHLDVLTANAVGGGSAIYSNVSLQPYRPNTAADCPVMSHWPLKLSDNDYKCATGWMEAWRGKAAPIVTTTPVDPSWDLTKLDAIGNPTVDYSYLYLPRSKALKRAAGRLTSTTTILEGWKPLPLQLFEHGLTAPGALKDQRICERQGRCFLGCLPGARHTLNKIFFGGLLAFIESAQLKLRPRSNVRSVTQGPNNTWDVRYYDVLTGNERIVRTPTVIFAAGVLGTVEILMRSRAAGLSLSERLGHGFSTNGDFSGFVVDIPKALKANPPNPNKLVDNRVFPTKGPINTSHVTFQVDGGRLVNVEDAGIPAMFAKAAKRILKSTNKQGVNFFEFIAQLFSRDTERQTEPEMVEDTFWFNCMGDDGDPQKPFRDVGGRFGFSHDKLTLDYDPKDHAVFGAVEDLLKKFAVAMDEPDKADPSTTPRYVPFPLWSNVIGSPKLVITHPLGGCIMGADATEGAVSTEGRLYSGPSGTATHKGLFVMDGSVSPGPVAVNPSLSIVAIALRIADAVAADLNMTVKKYC